MITTDKIQKENEMKIQDCAVGVRVYANGIFGTITNIARGRVPRGTCRITVKLDDPIEEYGNKKTLEINCAPGYLDKTITGAVNDDCYYE